jgi:hypothetical protein
MGDLHNLCAGVPRNAILTLRSRANVVPLRPEVVGA